MPEYLAPGVYIEEIERGRKPIEAVATSTAAFIGKTARGRIEPRLIRLITSCYEYLRYFGDVFVGESICCVRSRAFSTMAVGVTASSVSLVLTRSRRKRHRRIHGQSRRSRPYRHRYAGFYYPWIYFNDLRSGARTRVPPGGSMCGIYSRSDNTRGVCKAPVNETVAGVLDLEFDMDQGSQEFLNLSGVNVIRQSPGRGIRVWGARTLSSDP